MELLIFLAIIGLLIASQSIINSTFNKYSKIEANLDYKGVDVAEQILARNGVTDVSFGMTRGTLDDYYDPTHKRINLSKNSYQTNTIAAIAVAAHETGHAVQDAKGYGMLKIRKLLAPICSFSSKFVWVLIFIGLILGALNLVLLGLVLMGITIVFQLITLPVEFDASNRAIACLEHLGYDEYTMNGAKKMLKAAAFTYVASTIASILQLIRLILGLNRND